jgi:hypothetical protein
VGQVVLAQCGFTAEQRLPMATALKSESGVLNRSSRIAMRAGRAGSEGERWVLDITRAALGADDKSESSLVYAQISEVSSMRTLCWACAG